MNPTMMILRYMVALQEIRMEERHSFYRAKSLRRNKAHLCAELGLNPRCRLASMVPALEARIAELRAEVGP